MNRDKTTAKSKKDQYDLHWWIMAIAGAAAIFIALATISFQAIKSSVG